MSRKRISLPEPTTLDKFIGWISPEAFLRSLRKGDSWNIPRARGIVNWKELRIKGGQTP